MSFIFVNGLNGDGRIARRRLNEEEGVETEIPASSFETSSISSTSGTNTVCTSCQQPGHSRSTNSICPNYVPRRRREVPTDPVSSCGNTRLKYVVGLITFFFLNKVCT